MNKLLKTRVRLSPRPPFCDNEDYNKIVNPQFFDLVKLVCSPITLIGETRLTANILIINYILSKSLEGDVVEIGVWRGGSVVSMIMALKHYNNTSKHVHLYDTYEGMTETTSLDVRWDGTHAENLIKENEEYWKCAVSLDEVKKNVSQIEYPPELIHYHKGDICKTQFVPDKISFLRLDTDWYESTKCELEMFYPRVVSGGMIAIDDYGYWRGCRKAVDEFLADKPEIKVMEIDYTSICFVKP
jgi:O-methyltransferase